MNFKIYLISIFSFFIRLACMFVQPFRAVFNQHAKKLFFKNRLLPVGRERYLKNAFYPDLNFICDLQSHGVRAEGKGMKMNWKTKTSVFEPVASDSCKITQIYWRKWTLDTDAYIHMTLVRGGITDSYEIKRIHLKWEFMSTRTQAHAHNGIK